MADAVNTKLEPLLRVEDVMKYLGCSRQQIYVLLEAGHLERVNLPYRSLRFRRQDVEALARRRAEATPDADGFKSTTVEGGGTTRAEVAADLQQRAAEDDDIVRILSDGKAAESDAG
jgi:excisionase family DNA binding protein